MVEKVFPNTQRILKLFEGNTDHSGMKFSLELIFLLLAFRQFRCECILLFYNVTMLVLRPLSSHINELLD